MDDTRGPSTNDGYVKDAAPTWRVVKPFRSNRFKRNFEGETFRQQKRRSMKRLRQRPTPVTHSIARVIKRNLRKTAWLTWWDVTR